MAQVTISELLGLQQIVKARYGELVSLRDRNSATQTRFYGANADKPVETKPQYSAVKLDKIIAGLAREQRLMDAALKKANATLAVPDYSWDDSVLGELAEAEATV